MRNVTPRQVEVFELLCFRPLTLAPAPAPAPAPAQSSLFFGMFPRIFWGVRMGSQDVFGEFSEKFSRGLESSWRTLGTPLELEMGILKIESGWSSGSWKMELERVVLF